jgi:hypothetical protein
MEKMAKIRLVLVASHVQSSTPFQWSNSGGASLLLQRQGRQAAKSNDMN